MDEPPFSLAFVMVKESFAGPAILFYLASDANKTSVRTTLIRSNRRGDPCPARKGLPASVDPIFDLPNFILSTVTLMCI